MATVHASESHRNPAARERLATALQPAAHQMIQEEILRGSLLAEPVDSSQFRRLKIPRPPCCICGSLEYDSLCSLERHFKACQKSIRCKRKKMDSRFQLRYNRRVQTIVGHYKVKAKEMSLLAIGMELGITDLNELVHTGHNSIRFPRLKPTSMLLFDTMLDVPSTARYFRQEHIPEPSISEFGPYKPVPQSEEFSYLVPGCRVLGQFNKKWYRGTLIKNPCLDTGYRYYIQYDIDETLDLLPPPEIRVLELSSHVSQLKSAPAPMSQKSPSPPPPPPPAPATMTIPTPPSLLGGVGPTGPSRHDGIAANVKNVARKPWKSEGTFGAGFMKDNVVSSLKNNEEELSEWLKQSVEHYCSDLLSGGESYREVVFHSSFLSLSCIKGQEYHLQRNQASSLPGKQTGPQPSLQLLEKARRYLQDGRARILRQIKAVHEDRSEPN